MQELPFDNFPFPFPFPCTTSRLKGDDGGDCGGRELSDELRFAGIKL